MTEDEKLLMLAAKAEGREPPIDVNGVWSAWVGSAENGHWWNPLEDDGDALRLAFYLGMSVDLGSCIVEFDEHNGLLWDGSDGDICHARRAVVRAAAEIGKLLP